MFALIAGTGLFMVLLCENPTNLWFQKHRKWCGIGWRKFILLYKVAPTSENQCVHCVGHVVRFSEHI